MPKHFKLANKRNACKISKIGTIRKYISQNLQLYRLLGYIRFLYHDSYIYFFAEIFISD